MNTIKAFLSETFGTVHATMEKGQMYMDATEVAKILGYSDATHMKRTVSDDEIIKLTTPTKDGKNPQTKNWISEAGVYSAIISRQPQIDDTDPDKVALRKKLVDFRRWVTGTVVPAVVEKGSYIDKEELLSDKQRAEQQAQVDVLRTKIDAFIKNIWETYREILDTAEYMSDATIRRLERQFKRETGLDLDIENFGEKFGKKLDSYINTSTAAKGLIEGIRVINTADGPLFIADDVAKKFDYGRGRDFAKNVDADEKVDIAYNGTHVTAFTVSGLYHCILAARPDKSTALTQGQKDVISENLEAFRKKVFGTILPTIRETGGYIEGQELTIGQFDKTIASLSLEAERLGQISDAIEDAKDDFDDALIDQERDD